MTKSRIGGPGFGNPKATSDLASAQRPYRPQPAALPTAQQASLAHTGRSLERNAFLLGSWLRIPSIRHDTRSGERGQVLLCGSGFLCRLSARKSPGRTARNSLSTRRGDTLLVGVETIAHVVEQVVPAVGGCFQVVILRMRSEERRVGKECRSRWS